jgi:hypothetical protein
MRAPIARDGTVDTTHEFCADEIEIPVPCYPIETVTGFQVKANEAEGWMPRTGVDYVIRRGCVVSLAVPLSPHPPYTVPSVARAWSRTASPYGVELCCRTSGAMS